jgi:putative transposase
LLKTLSENLSVKLEQRNISPRMGLLMSPFSKEMPLVKEPNTTKKSVDYFCLPRPLWRKLKKCLPNRRRSKKKAPKRGGRPRASDRAVINGIWYVLWTGCQWKAVHRDWFGVSSSVIHERFQSWTRMGIFEKLMKKMVEYYAKERGGIGWRWQSIDSKSCAAPLGGSQTGKNPTDRGKLGAKINLMVDQRGAPLSVVLTGANRHDKISAIDLIGCVLVKRPAHREQHLCADKAYDATDLRACVRSSSWLQSMQHQVDHRDQDECLTALRNSFIVFTQAPTAPQPSERPLHYPSPRKHHEASLSLLPLHYRERPPRECLYPFNQPPPKVSPIRPDQLQAG